MEWSVMNSWIYQMQINKRNKGSIVENHIQYFITNIDSSV